MAALGIWRQWRAAHSEFAAVAVMKLVYPCKVKACPLSCRQVPMFENCEDAFIGALVQLFKPQVDALPDA